MFEFFGDESGIGKDGGELGFFVVKGGFLESWRDFWNFLGLVVGVWEVVKGDKVFGIGDGRVLGCWRVFF